MLSSYAKREWLTVLAIGLMLSITLIVVQLWWLLIVVAIVTAAVLSFFRDPDRCVPLQRGVVVSPADGRISSVHRIDPFEPFGEPATCIRIFLSVFSVHVNRCPCHGMIESISQQPGRYRNALNPSSAEVNQATLVILSHPVRRCPVAAVRQVAGMLARTIVCDATVGETLQRGQRFGMIKLGSTTELYLPQSLSPQVLVQRGQKVIGGVTVMANVTTPQDPSAGPSVAIDEKTDKPARRVAAKG